MHLQVLAFIKAWLIISNFIKFCFVSDFKNRNRSWTAKLSKYPYRYYKLCKSFSKFYQRHSELIMKYNFGLKLLLQHGIPETVFYGDLVYKLKKLVGKPYFHDRFRKITKQYKKSGIQHGYYATFCSLVVFTVYSYDFLFNCTMVGQASSSMMTPA